MRIKKVSQTTATQAQVVDGYSTSTIDSYSCNYMNSVNIYSTNEIKTNKIWIDNKPIYRKVFSISNISSGTTATVGTINNLDTPLFINGFSFFNIWTPIPRTHASDLIYQNQVYIDNNNVKVGCGSGSAISTGFVIVEYTKTTD